MTIAIVPAYNEENTVGSVVRNLFSSAHVDHVVVIDDGSSDRTGEVAREAGAVVIRHALNRGQGAALETGQEYARRAGAEYVLHFDADGQFDAHDIPGAIAHLREAGADILFGSRFLDHRSNIPWLKRAILLPIARSVDAFMGAVPLSDAHNGFRILNRRALSALRITQDRMAHATEIPVLTKQHGLRVVEYPVKVTYRSYGQGTTRGFEVLKDLFLGRFLG